MPRANRSRTNKSRATLSTLGLLLVAAALILSPTPALGGQKTDPGKTDPSSAMDPMEGTSHGGHPGADPHAHHRAMLAARSENKVNVEKVGDLTIPDLPVLTQDGEEVHFFHDLVAGRVVAMNFIFTTCRTICPPLGANFGKLQTLLGDRAGRDVYLISVSVDPVTDTPERLKAWGETFGAGPGWTLVTGSKVNITQILKALQVFTPDFNDHSPVILMGNAGSGTWTRAYGLAPPKDLAGLLEGMVSQTSGTQASDAHTSDAQGGDR